MLQLINAVRIGNNGVGFGGYYAALRDVKHALPPINNLPLFNHARDLGVTGVNKGAGFAVVPWPIDVLPRHHVGTTFVGRAQLLLIKSWIFHNLIQGPYLIVFRFVTLISLILIYCFVALN